MRFLLDTHTLLWWWGDPEKLSDQAIILLKDPKNRIFVSAASAIEVATKTRVGKLDDGRIIVESWDQRLQVDGFLELAIASKHALKAGIMSGEHRDPFDRLLSAQSLIENLPVIGCDPSIPRFGVKQLW